MNTLNAIIATIVGWMLAPFTAAPAIGLIVLGIAFGAVATVCYRYCSNQKALRRVSDNTRASLLAVWLFGDDARVGFRAQGSLLVAAFARLWYSLPPLLVMLVPFTLLLTHMAMYYEFRPFTPAETQRGQSALLEVELAAAPPTTLTPSNLPFGVRLDGRVVTQQTRTVAWRLRADAPTTAAITMPLDSGPVAEKLLVISDRIDRLALASPRRAGANFWDRLLYPAEPAFAADSPIRAISIQYPKRSTPIFGFDLPWWLTFLLASFIGAFAAKPFLRVQF